MTKDSLLSGAQWNEKEIGVIGDIMLDYYITGDAERISPEAPTPVVTFTGEEYVPGGAGNAAYSVAALGARVSLFGLVGNDASGMRLRSIIQERGIDTRGIVVDEARPTIKKMRIVARGHQMLRIDREWTSPISRLLERKILKGMEDRIREWDAILISDYAKGMITNHLAHAVIRLAKEYGIPVVVNPKPQHFTWFRGADIIIPNAREASVALGRSVVSRADAEAAARVIARQCRAAVVVTRGSEGMTVFDSKKFSHLPACAREVADVTGASDTVSVVVALGMASGMPLAEAAELANHAAGVAVSKPGTATVSLEELRYHIGLHA